MSRFTFGLCLLCAVASAFGDEPAKDSPAAQMPWMHPGALITSEFSVMSLPGQGIGFTLDKEGNWVGSDGTHLNAADRPASSASGLTQVGISCVDNERVYVVAHNFQNMQLLGFPDPLASGQPATLAVPAELCDMWMSPVKLANLKSDGAVHLVVQNVQWPKEGKTVDAISVSRVLANGWINHIFERSTGLCLHAAESTTGAAPQLKYLAPGDTRAGDTLLTIFDFVSIRDQKIPWVDETMPAWCNQFKVLHYTGTAGNPAAQFSMPAQLGLDVSRKDSGKDWLSVDTSGWMMLRGQPTPPVKTIIFSGQGQFGGFFAGPTALAKLQADQVLDEDPATHIKTTVTQADGHSVTITSSSRGAMVSYTYDVATGKLTATSRTDVQTKIKTTFRLMGEE